MWRRVPRLPRHRGDAPADPGRSTTRRRPRTRCTSRASSTQRLAAAATLLAVADAGGARRGSAGRRARAARARRASRPSSRGRASAARWSSCASSRPSRSTTSRSSRAPSLGHNPNRLSRRVVALLERLRNPLLVVKGHARRLRRILVCTAAGEPGKADVSAAGRLARRLGASVGRSCTCCLPATRVSRVGARAPRSAPSAPSRRSTSRSTS